MKTVIFRGMYMETTQTKEITPDTTMGEILNHYPSAKRALFQKYHIGGCSSCGYSLDQSLQEVMVNHRREKEVTNAIHHIYESYEFDKKIQITPTDLKAKLDNGEKIHLVDVREDWELEIANIPNSHLLTQQLAYEILQKWDKQSMIVFYCHTGARSLEAASYFKGHGLPNCYSLSGGIDQFSTDVDPSISKY
jgi:rhodanese-related sulfurtransferase